MELIPGLWTPVERPPSIMQGKTGPMFYIYLSFLFVSLKDVFSYEQG